MPSWTLANRTFSNSGHAVFSQTEILRGGLPLRTRPLRKHWHSAFSEPILKG